MRAIQKDPAQRQQTAREFAAALAAAGLPTGDPVQHHAPGSGS